MQNINILVKSFFEKLNFDLDSIEILEEQSNIFLVKIKTKDSGLLIGAHGKTLEAIGHILKLLISKRLDKRVRVHVEVNDYLESKEEKLFNFIKQKIEYLKSNNKEIKLPFFTAYERKKIHSYISENHDTIYTESKGDGKDRRMYLGKKAEKLSIDIDGDDI